MFVRICNAGSPYNNARVCIRRLHASFNGASLREARLISTLIVEKSLEKGNEVGELDAVGVAINLLLILIHNFIEAHCKGTLLFTQI